MATFVGNALYAHAKQGCYLCVRGDGLVDLGVDIVGEGALVLCKGCIAEAAEAASLTFNRAQLRELEAALAEKRDQLTLAVAREAAFAAALEAATAVEPTVPELLAIPDPPERCTATTKAGAPCKGQPVAGTERCMSHA